MKSFVALALAASALANPMPVPQEDTPEGCQDSWDGEFTITTVNVTDMAKRSLGRRQQAGVLSLTLEDGELKDQAGRTGYIAANNQFQFDEPVQAGALKTDGFSVCSNGSLALDGSAIWYQCWSGGFYNLYDVNTAEQCNQIYILAQDGDAPPATQISDGQPQVPTEQPEVSQISDGQPQAPTGQPPVTQISDGQPQVPTGGPPVTQISDGQPQVPTAGPPVTQISDGQPQAPTGAPVTQISDGQPQAPSPTLVGTDTVISMPSGNLTTPTVPAPSQFTGAAAVPTALPGALAAGLMGLAALL